MGAVDRIYAEMQAAQSQIRKMVEAAARDYAMALKSLWVGNGAAAVAVLNFLGQTWNQTPSTRVVIYPLTAFILGLCAMAVGSISQLYKQRKVITDNEEAMSVLDLKADAVKTPIEETGMVTGLPFYMAVLSGGAFLTGVILGIYQIAKVGF